MDEPRLRLKVIDAWRATAQYVAGHATEFSDQSKEMVVFRRLRKEIEAIPPSISIIGPDDQERFNRQEHELIGGCER